MTQGPAPDDRLPQEPEEVGVPEGPREGEGSIEGEEPRQGEGPEDPEERRYPSTIGGAFYLLVLVTSAIGIGIVMGGNWRLGIRLLASALVAASALRLVLPERDAGMLAVRHRSIDCTVLAGVGGALFWLAASIPEQPL